MDDVYAVKQIAFLGTPVTVICQNINGPCPLLAICNVLLLRGHLSIQELVSQDGLISAHDLMRVVQNRLVAANPLVPGSTELERLTREKTLQDVIALLPSLLVGLDVNVRFHKITDFEYTVACAVFDMLDIALVHGWLLDDQDANTVGRKEQHPFPAINKSYNELVERLVEYRSVLMTERESEKTAPSAEGADAEPDLETKMEPVLPVSQHFNELTFDADVDEAEVLASPSSSTSSLSSPSQKKSPSTQTVQVMMKERHISDADALNTATALLEEGPILEEFFNSSASQLTYYGLVKLHEEVRERQLCVFFRNNHFSTLFKCDGALYLLVTDAGYLDEPTVVWERLNEIDGDSGYFDANFRTLNVSETKQQSILTQQEHEKKRVEEAQIQAAQDTLSAASDAQDVSLQDEEHSDLNADPDYLLALRLQEEEEARVNGPKRVSPAISPRRDPSPANRSPDVEFEDRRDCSSNDRDDSGARDDDDQRRDGDGVVNADDIYPLTADGQLMISEEELEAQRQAERFYQERKRQFDEQSYQLQREQQQQQQQQQQQAGRANQGPRRSPAKNDRNDCSLM